MTTKMSKAEAGRLGGRATFNRHGVEHMRAIGKRGFAALATFARGGRQEALVKLVERGRMRFHRPLPPFTEADFEALYESIVAGTTDEPLPY
jgi:hypothetical protein